MHVSVCVLKADLTIVNVDITSSYGPAQDIVNFVFEKLHEFETAITKFKTHLQRREPSLFFFLIGIDNKRLLNDAQFRVRIAKLVIVQSDEREREREVRSLQKFNAFDDDVEGASRGVPGPSNWRNINRNRTGFQGCIYI